jgi:hypothetical protein
MQKIQDGSAFSQEETENIAEFFDEEIRGRDSKSVL